MVLEDGYSSDCRSMPGCFSLWPVGLVMGSSQGGQVEPCHLLGEIIHNDPSPWTIRALGERRGHPLLVPSSTPRATWGGKSCLWLAFYTPGTKLCHSRVGGGFTPARPCLFSHSHIGGSAQFPLHRVLVRTTIPVNVY